MPDTKKDAAYRLRQVIDWMEMSKTEFAAYLGDIQSSRLSGWITGDYLPPVEFMLKLKRDKGISLDWIYDGDGNGQIGGLTKSLEAIKPTPLRLKPRQRKSANAKKRAAA